MNNFLNTALEQNNTIIIPGFGALTITSARTRDIYFIPYLKHDDGTLIKVICEITGNDIESSKLYIKEFVDTINQSIESNSLFEINDFGRFKKIPSGEIEFEKWSDYHKTEKPKKTINKKVDTIKKETKEKNNDRKNRTANKEIIESKPLETYLPEINHSTLDEILNESSLNTINSEDDKTLSKEEKGFNNEEIIKEIIDESSLTTEQITTNITKENTDNQINEKLENDTFEDKELYNDQTNNTTFEEVIIPKTKSKRKNKKDKTEKAVESIINENLNPPEKKRKKILPWIIISLGIISGALSYILYSKKNEKINEKEISVNKESKTEIVKTEKKEEVKKPLIKKEKTVITKKTKQNITINSLKKINSKEEQHIKTKKKELKLEVGKIQENNNLTNSNSEKETESKENKKNTRPSKKELKEADEIVAQLNTNKKNLEAVNTIKTTVKTKIKENIANKNIENTENKNQINISTSNVSKNVQTMDKKNTNQSNLTNPNNNSPQSTNKQNSLESKQINTSSTIGKMAPTNQNNTNLKTTTTTANNSMVSNQKNSTITTNQKLQNTTTSNINNKPLTQQQTTTSKIANQTSVKTPQTQSTVNTKNVTLPTSNTSAKNTTISTVPLPGGKAGKKIELIAETFKDKVSAEKLVSKLKDGGYKNTRIEEKDGQYNVVIDSYNTLSETVKELKKYRSQ